MSSSTTRAPSFLRRPALRWFAVAETSGTVGYAVYTLAIVWLAAGRGGGLGVAGAALGVEFGIYSLSFLVGPFVDRAASPRRIALAGYVAQAAVAGLLGALAAAGPVRVPVLLGLVAALSIAWDFTWTAQNTLFPRLLGKEELLPATGFLGTAGGVVQVLGTGAAAVLLSVSGSAAAMLLYAGFNVLAVVALVPVPDGPATPTTTGLLASYPEGWRYLLRTADRPLLPLAVVSAAEGAVTAAPALLIVLDAGGTGAASAAAYGAYGTALAVGAVAGSAVLGAANPHLRIGAWLLAGAAIEAMLFAVVPLASGILVASIAVWLAMGLIEVMPFTAVSVYVQATTPPELLGRTYSNMYLFRGSGRTVGSIVLGATAALVGLREISLVLAVYLGLAVLATAVALPAVRRLAF